MRAHLQRFALLVFGLVAALALCEIILRVFAPIPYSMRLEYMPDGHLGARLVPDRVYTLADGGHVTVNALGFRGSPDLDWVKPRGVYRIAALGGSSTFCFNTDDSAIWTRRLEDKLNAVSARPVEVVNAGVPGFSIFVSNVHYLYRVRELDPDAVITYHGWNDMKYFRAVEAGRGAIRTRGYRPQRLKRFLRSFQLSWRLRALLGGPGALLRRPENVIDGSAFPGPTVPEGGRAHRWQRLQYMAFGHLLRQEGRLPVFVAQSSLVSPETIADPEVRTHIASELQGLSDEEVLRQTLAIQRIIREAAEEHDAIFVDSYSQVPHDLVHFHDHVHLTAAGNEAVAEAIFRGLAADPRIRAELRIARDPADVARARADDAIGLAVE